MEIIDIFDADLRPLGQKERRAAHIDGDWHKSFHLWVVGSARGGTILYQWRSREMESFPDVLDVSAAGHILAGESVEQGIREAEEELGIKFSGSDIHDLGYRVEVADETNGQRNREYQAVRMARVDRPVADFNPRVEEVSGLYWIGIADGLELFTEKRETVIGRGIVFNESMQEWESTEREFNRGSFLPRIQNYYLTAHIMAERLLENRMPLSIS